MNPFKESDIAFVTGAGSGIGRATCQLLAEQGATVVVADINKKSADDTVLGLPGKNHLSLHLDVSKKGEVSQAIAYVISKYSSPPTIAVNCAGVLITESLLDVTEDTCNRLFDINFKGTMWVTQVICQELVATKRKGSIVNMSSMSKEGDAYGPIYSATKGAIDSFTFSAAKEFGPYGIRVNAVTPGAIATNLLAPYEDRCKYYIERNPLRRLGNPEEAAEVIVFLASEKSSYVNGTSIYLHGGHK